MSLNVTTAGSEVQINICTVGATITFRRNSSTEVDAAAMADVVKRAIADLTASDNRKFWEERDRRIVAERAATALRGQVTKLKNRLGVPHG